MFGCVHLCYWSVKCERHCQTEQHAVIVASREKQGARTTRGASKQAVELEQISKKLFVSTEDLVQILRCFLSLADWFSKIAFFLAREPISMTLRIMSITLSVY